MPKTHISTPTEDLPKQFLVTRERLDPPPGWQKSTLGGFNIYRSPGVGWTRIVTPTSTPDCETCVLGWFAYGDHFYPAQGSDELLTGQSVEAMYPHMTGRFLVLRFQNGQLFCTTDAGAQFPAVYRPQTGEVGSTPLVLGWTLDLQEDLAAAADFQRTDGTVWYPFGATPFVGIERLLPGRTIALDAGGVRLTDTRPAVTTPLDTAGMYRLVGDFIGAIYRLEGDLECHLTAGWDSRMVLAASWPLRKRITYLTYLAKGANACVDRDVADSLARRFGLVHEKVPLTPASQDDIDRWAWRTSNGIRDSVVDLTTTIVETYQHRYGLSGVGGEVGRAFYWKKRDMGVTGLTPEQLLDRLGFVKTAGSLQRADRWLQGYPEQTRSRILDHAYIDIRLGCWAGPALTGHGVEKPTLSPFNSMAVFESMLALPETYRLSGGFARDFIAQACPDLARVPFNRRSGLRRLHGLPREVAKRMPKTTKARIRRLLSVGQAQGPARG